jgi:hypothetical protein
MADYAALIRPTGYGLPVTSLRPSGCGPCLRTSRRRYRTTPSTCTHSPVANLAVVSIISAKKVRSSYRRQPVMMPTRTRLIDCGPRNSRASDHALIEAGCDGVGSGGLRFAFFPYFPSDFTMNARFSSWCASAVQLREIFISTVVRRAEFLGSAPRILCSAA